MRAWARGSVLVEGCFAIGLLTFGLMLNLEIVRRAQFEVVLHHAIFLYTRDRALGENVGVSRRDATGFLAAALGDAKGRAMARRLRFRDYTWDGGIEGSVFYRYPFFIPFSTAGMRVPNNQPTRHHFEMTKKCRFPLSYSSSR